MQIKIICLWFILYSMDPEACITKVVGCCCFTSSWLSQLWFLLWLNAMTNSDLERRGFIYISLYLSGHTPSLMEVREGLKAERSLEVRALEEWGSMLALQGLLSLPYSSQDPISPGVAPSTVSWALTHWSVIKKIPHKLYLKCLMELRLLFQDDPSLCQIYIKQANTLCRPNYV